LADLISVNPLGRI